MNGSQHQTVDGYIAKSDETIRPTLERIRAVIKQAAPEATESIAYGMPAYKLNGRPLVYFACFPNHIGFYATPQGHDAFEAQLSKYKHGKGSVQFPLDAVPYDLIAKITKFKAQSL